MPSRRFKRKVQQEDIIGSEAALVLPEARREEARERSIGSQAQSEEGA
mgnify:CR=1 FL=1